MAAYIIRRILFMIPTLFGIMLVSFVVVQFAPGGPIATSPEPKTPAQARAPDEPRRRAPGTDRRRPPAIADSGAADLGKRRRPTREPMVREPFKRRVHSGTRRLVVQAHPWPLSSVERDSPGLAPAISEASRPHPGERADTSCPPRPHPRRATTAPAGGDVPSQKAGRGARSGGRSAEPGKRPQRRHEPDGPGGTGRGSRGDGGHVDIPETIGRRIPESGASDSVDLADPAP